MLPREKKTIQQFTHVVMSKSFLVCFFFLYKQTVKSLTSLLGKGEKLDSSGNLYLSSTGSQPNCASVLIFIILTGGCVVAAPASLLGGMGLKNKSRESKNLVIRHIK